MDLLSIARTMYRSSFFWPAALIGTTIALIQPAVQAKSASEIEKVARSVTVEIQLKQADRVGSGVIIQRQGDLYTLVTNRHVICGTSNCQQISASEVYTLGLVGGQRYQAQKSAIRLLGNDLDLAIIQFRSNRNYPVAQISAPSSLKVTDKVYTAGFPRKQFGFGFAGGEAIAVVNKRLQGDGGGYTIIYDAATEPGMSGGGVFDQNGYLVAIHGWGDRYQSNTQTLPADGSAVANNPVGSKIGYNRGIPINWVVSGLTAQGIPIEGGRSVVSEASAAVARSADEHFIAGFNNLVEPGNNIPAGKKRAVQEFSLAIRQNSRYAIAYFMRGITYDQLQQHPQALADLNQSISINPDFYLAYYIRANLKKNVLADAQGALSDYNRSISLSSQFAEAYINRAILKDDVLKDAQGALADYNQAIAISPQDPVIYNNRGLLKAEKFNDPPGALADYNRAIALDPELVYPYFNRGNLKQKQLRDFPGALADYNQALVINPKYADVYYNRALLHRELNEPQAALADIEQYISFKPQDAKAYRNRGALKSDLLKDSSGALADYNRAIALDPKYDETYVSRGNLKDDQFNDISGALADYNQAITLNPKSALAYYNRGVLKINRFRDLPGAIQDLRPAARLFREQGETQYLQVTLKILKDLGATE
jgi:tetratricopeptide (TPR) repeat protein